MASAEDQHPVGDLGPGGEHEPLRVSVRARASRRDLDHFDACAGQDRVERRAELPGTVTHQETETGGAFSEIHQAIADLLHSPRPVLRVSYCPTWRVSGRALWVSSGPTACVTGSVRSRSSRRGRGATG